MEATEKTEQPLNGLAEKGTLMKSELEIVAPE